MTTYNLFIGAANRNTSGAVSPFDGNIAQVGIWAGALTQAAIQEVKEKSFNELSASDKSSLTTLVEDDCADSGLGDWSGDATEAFDTDHYDLTYAGNGNHGMDATIVASQLYKLTCDIKIKTDYSGTLKYFTYDGSLNTYTSDFKSEVNDSSYTTITKNLVANSSGGSGTAGFSVNTAGAISVKNFKVNAVNGNAGLMVNFDGSDFKTDTH